MTYRWTKWKRVKNDLDPYIDWSLKGPGEDRIGFLPGDPTVPRDGDYYLQTIPQQIFGDDRWIVFEELDQIVVPKVALNPTTGGEVIPKPPVKSELPSGKSGTNSTKIRKDTIIAGVVDVGMPLGHRRLRFADGKTRVLSAWQMVGDWDLKKQDKIPFGCEFYEDEINKKLRDFSDGNLLGRLEENAFHQALGVLDFSRISRQTSVANRASHGAHVLDMVAGASLDDADEFSERVRVIAVNAPSSAIFGASGTYLDSYMLHAIQRIADVSDGIWTKMSKAGEEVPRKGFPIVINLSFGKHAGSKDTLDRFAAAIKQFQDLRKKTGKSRIDIVMPTGNDNLAQCNAFLKPKRRETLPLNWRMQPQDQSSNFTEIWFEDDKQKAKKQRPAIELSLAPPGGPPVSPPAPPRLRPGWTRFSKLERNGTVVGHLYISRVNEKRRTRSEPRKARKSRKAQLRYRYILCLTPTFRLDGSPSVAQSGLWEISLKNSAKKRIQAVLSVQTDQGLSPNRTINRRSYFDDPFYLTHASDGRLLESYSYPKDKNGKFQNLDILANTPVRRHGTMNATAAHKAVARVGGYRASDGRPAFYSSTGRGRTNGADSGTEVKPSGGKNSARAPTAALPTDDGHAHGGILSGGSVDGSRVVMRGTSFASSQAARLMISERLAGRGKRGVRSAIWKLAQAAERRVETNGPQELTYDVELIEVIGGGRIPAPQQRKPRRVQRSPFDG
ncbi:MAG: hypothetical protein QNJ20_02530 [Paracoccaceae bacterium]|nr:hypothetical protein [Paracoccaceae bacterium]